MALCRLRSTGKTESIDIKGISNTRYMFFHINSHMAIGVMTNRVRSHSMCAYLYDDNSQLDTTSRR